MIRVRVAYPDREPPCATAVLLVLRLLAHVTNSYGAGAKGLETRHACERRVSRKQHMERHRCPQAMLDCSTVEQSESVIEGVRCV